MTDLKFTKIEMNKNVATVILNRPEVHNAFNDEMIEELISVFTNLEADSKVRLVVLEGTGPSFCAGADLNWMKKMKDYTYEQNKADSLRLATLFKTINFLKKPVIAAVNGPVYGGGVGLIAACDTVIASEDATFALTEAKLGLLPAVISPYVMAKIGESNARYYFLTGDKFTVEEAKQMGLVHKISLSRHFNNDKEKLIDTFLKAAPHAQRTAKQLIFNIREKSLDKDVTELEAITTSMIADIRIGAEAQEGMQAILEKRRPNFHE